MLPPNTVLYSELWTCLEEYIYIVKWRLVSLSLAMDRINLLLVSWERNVAREAIGMLEEFFNE